MSKEKSNVYPNERPFEITIKMKISEQEVEDMLITALEGGSNYWYWLDDLSMVHNLFPGKELAMSEKISRAVMRFDVAVPVYDLEEREEKLGEITRDNIQRGIEKYFESGKGLMGPDGWTDTDAEGADIFFQYVVMGEIVFG